MIIRTMTVAVVALAMAAPIAANAHLMRFPHAHSGGSTMTNRMDPRLAMEAEMLARCINGTAPRRMCALMGY